MKYLLTWKILLKLMGFRPSSCTYRLNWARKTYWGWRVDEMTLPSRHRIRNSCHDGLRPSTLPLGHGGSPQYWIFTREREETFCFFENWIPERVTSPRSPTFQAGSFNHCNSATWKVGSYCLLTLRVGTTKHEWPAGTRWSITRQIG